MDEDKITLRLQDATYNAGLLGLIRLADFMGKYLGREDAVYEAGENTVTFSRSLFDRDFADAYIQYALYREDKEDCRLMKIRRAAERLAGEVPGESFWDDFDRVKGYFNKKSRKGAVMTTVKEGDPSGEAFLRTLEAVKKTTGAAKARAKPETVQAARGLMGELAGGLRDGKVQDRIRFQDIINETWKSGKYWFGGTKAGSAFFAGTKKMIPEEEAYAKDFIIPVTEHTGKGDLSCCMCGEPIKKTEKGKEITIVRGYQTDLKRKTSQAWDHNNDIRICPYCAVVYSCLPFGFTELGEESIFVNASENIGALERANAGTWETGREASSNSYAYILNAFFTEARLTEGKSLQKNIQVLRCIDAGGFRLTTFTPAVQKGLCRAEEDLRYIAKFPRFSGILTETVEAALNDGRVYPMLGQDLRKALACENLKAEEKSLYRSRKEKLGLYRRLLRMQALVLESKKEEYDMGYQNTGGRGAKEDPYTKAETCGYLAGRRLREKMLSTGSSGTKAVNEKKINGLLIRLLQALASRDQAGFAMLAERWYVSLGMEIDPAMQKVISPDTDIFEITGHAFIIGLGSEPHSKKAENKEEN